jgi:hypothetical protein
MQAKYKIHDRWGQRQEDIGPGLVKTETSDNFENRARNMEMRIKSNKGEELFARTKRETFEEDYRREGRNIGRGLEGGFDEELDFDVNEEFQDDEDSNTFYINKDEEDEKKIQEVRCLPCGVMLTTRNVRSRSSAGRTPTSATGLRSRVKTAAMATAICSATSSHRRASAFGA